MVDEVRGKGLHRARFLGKTAAVNHSGFINASVSV